MALTSNNNITSAKTLTPGEIKTIAKEVAGEVVAEKIGANRAKAQRDLDDPDHAAKVALKAAEERHKEAARWASSGPWGKGRFDSLADKDPEEMSSLDKARMFVRSIQCWHFAQTTGTGHRGAIDRARDCGQESLAKALEASDFDSGGFMIQPAFADGIIEELVPLAVYLRALPPEALIEMPEGGFQQPYENDGADAQWAGESTEVNAEEITGGQINMQPRKLIAIVGASNDLLLGAPGKSDRFLLRSILRGMKTKLDSTLLRGVGSSSEPNGLSGLMLATNVFNATAEASLTQAILVEELIFLQTLLENANIDLESDTPYYFFSPRTKNYLRALRATDGKLFPEMEAEKMLLGAGFGATSNIPNNITASYSEIYFAALSHMMLGRTEESRVGIFPGGTYNNSSGTKVSGISADQTVFSIVGKWDHAAGQRGSEIARANNVNWT